MFRSPCWRLPFLRVRHPVAYGPRPRYPPFALQNGVSFTTGRMTMTMTTTSTTSRGDATVRTRVDPKYLMEDTESELFNYTTGRFLANEKFYLRERRRLFDIPGLFKIIAKTFSRNPEEIVAFRKLGEGGFNRIFLVTFDDDLQLIARIPFPRLTSKPYTLASEVATMDFLRSKGLPIPNVFSYSFSSNNEAQTEYILMEYIESSDLSEFWDDLQKEDIISLMNQLTQLESAMMSISFPAGGSVYYAEDLKSICGNSGIPLEGPFCIGPDIATPLWYGRREQLDVFRGPYTDAESVMVTGAKKELAYLERFGTPRVPYRHLNREHYGYKKQQPSEHAENLHLYLRLAPYLVPDDDIFNTFRIRHPDLRESNIKVLKDSRGLRIISVLDWQYAVVLPLFLHGGMPEFVQNAGDEVSESMVEPELPADFDQLPKEDQEREREFFRRRLVHFHYNVSTTLHNGAHHGALIYPLNGFRRRIYNESIVPWQGETFKLRYALMCMVGTWENFVEDDTTPCPVQFTENEEEAASKLYDALVGAEETEKTMLNIVGCGEDSWVPAATYENAKALAQKMKSLALENNVQRGGTEEERKVMEVNWPLNDMDDTDLQEYQ